MSLVEIEGSALSCLPALDRHLWHLRIQDRQVEGFRSLWQSTVSLEPLSRPRRSRSSYPRNNLVVPIFTVGLVVVYNQHAGSEVGPGLRRRGRVSSGCFFRGRVKKKVLPARSAVSSHQLDELLGMASPKPVPPYLRMVEVSAWLKD